MSLQDELKKKELEQKSSQPLRKLELQMQDLIEQQTKLEWKLSEQENSFAERNLTILETVNSMNELIQEQTKWIRKLSKQNENSINEEKPTDVSKATDWRDKMASAMLLPDEKLFSGKGIYYTARGVRNGKPYTRAIVVEQVPADRLDEASKILNPQ